MYLLITHGHFGTRFLPIEEPTIPEDHQMMPGDITYVVPVLDFKRERTL